MKKQKENINNNTNYIIMTNWGKTNEDKQFFIDGNYIKTVDIEDFKNKFISFSYIDDMLVTNFCYINPNNISNINKKDNIISITFKNKDNKPNIKDAKINFNIDIIPDIDKTLDDIFLQFKKYNEIRYSAVKLIYDLHV